MTLSTTNNGYETVEFLFKNGQIRRENINRPNPGREAYKAKLDDILGECYGFRYTFKQYVSFDGSRKNLVEVKSGIWYVDGIPHNRAGVVKYIRDEDLRIFMLNQMTRHGTDFAVHGAHDTWAVFDHKNDRCITA